MENEKTINSTNQVSAIFDQKNRFALIEVINLLDPGSFVKLARTCRAMYGICFYSSDIKVTVSGLHVTIDKYTTHYKLTIRKIKESGRRLKLPFLKSIARIRNTLEKYPFVFRCTLLNINWLSGENMISTVSSILQELKVKSINIIWIDLPDDWNGFFRILRDFNARYLILNNYEEETLPEEALRRLLTCNLGELVIEGIGLTTLLYTRVFHDLIIEATVPQIQLPISEMPEELFTDLIRKISNSTDDIHWTFQHRASLPDLLNRDHFVTLPCNFAGSIPDERPLIFLHESKMFTFFILRKDGKVVHYNRSACNKRLCSSEFSIPMLDNPKTYIHCLR